MAELLPAVADPAPGIEVRLSVLVITATQRTSNLNVYPLLLASSGIEPWRDQSV